MRTLDTCLLYLQQKKANFKALTCLVLFLYFIPLSNYACDQPSGSDNSNCGPGSVELTASGTAPSFNWYDAPSNGTLLWTGSTFNTPHLLATDTFYVSGVDTTTTNDALDLNSANAYAAIEQYHYNTTDNTELTVEAWIKTSNSGNQVIASFDRNEYWRLEINGNGAGPGRVGFDVMTNSGQLDFGGNIRIDDGDWHHVAGVFDNGSVRIYIDGILDVSTSMGTEFGNGTTRYGFIGTGSEANVFDGAKGPTSYFDGSIDELRIWSVARSQSQIQNSLNKCIDASESGLEIYYRMDGSGSDLTLTDYSGNGNNAELNNLSLPGAWISSGPNMNGCPDCESSRDMVVASIDIKPNPNLGSDICTDETAELDAGGGYSAYLWNTGETTQSITVDSTGYYFVTVDSVGAGCSGEAGVQVSVLSKPSADDTIKCGPGSVDLKANGSTGNYYWYDKSDSLVGSGSTFTTPLLTATDTFYVSAFDNIPTRNAIAFDGIDDYIALDMSYNTTGEISALTLEAWVKTSVSGGAWTSNWSIIDFDRSDYYNLFVTGDDGRVGFSTTDETGTIDDFYTSSADAVNDGAWHHIAAVYNGTDKIIYIDGVQVATKSNPHGGLDLGVGSVRYGFIGDGSEAGGFNGGRNNIYFEGEIDEVRIWSNVRNLFQIQNNKDACLSGTESGLQAYYKMDEGSDTSNLKDHSFNGNDGTLYNMASIAWNDLGPNIDCSCGESGMDTVIVKIEPIPNVDLGSDTCIVSASSYTLDAGSGFSAYEWKDGSTGQTLDAETSEAYWVVVDSAGTSCQGSDTVIVSVGIAAEPIANQAGVCGSGTLDLIANSTGMVRWWDAASGGSLLGEGDTLNVGPISSTTTYYASSTLESNVSLEFDGTDDYVAIGNKNYSGVGEIAELTLEAWVKTSVSGGAWNTNWSIVDFDRSDYYNFYVTGDNGRVGFSTTDETGSTDDFYSSTSHTVNDGEWHHIAAVYDGTDKIIYIDGTAVATKPNPHSGRNLGIGSTRYGFLGDGSEASGFDGTRNNLYFDGEIDEVRIWEATRSASDIDTYKDSCLNGNEAGLEIYYRIEKGNGSTLKDFAGANDGTINGAAWSNAGKRFNCSVCGESERIAVVANIYDAIDSTTFEISYPGKKGTVAILNPVGGSGAYDCKELSGIFNFDGNFQNPDLYETLPNGGTFNIALVDENGCRDTVQNIITSASPALNGLTASSSSAQTHLIPAVDDWFYVINSANEAILSINPKGNDLGEVNAELFIRPTSNVYYGEAYMNRSYVINPEFQPSSSVDIRFYFSDSEFDNLLDTLNEYNGASLVSKSDLSITKYEGPTEDGVYDPTDAVSLITIAQNKNGTEFGANFMELSSESFSEFWMKDGTSTGLPIELVEFTARLENQEVVLDWTTASEINNDYFTIERSENGIVFEEIAKVRGAGNSVEMLDYKAFDENPLNGVSYYRLKQTDYDGSFDYSELVIIENYKALETSLNVFPNPNDGRFHIKMNGLNSNESVGISIIDLAGKEVFRAEQVANGGELKLLHTPLNEMQSGIYFINCTTEKERFTKRIIVQ